MSGPGAAHECFGGLDVERQRNDGGGGGIWPREKQATSSERQTVAFCSTVAHAEHITDAFKAAGVSAARIHGDLAAETRKATFADYAAGDIRVVVIHGTLEQNVDLDCRTGTGEAFPRKDLDAGEGGAAAPLPLSGFMMTEIDLLKRSSFAWVDLYGTDDALMAADCTVWGGIFWLDGVWYAIGRAKGERPHLLAVGGRTVCLAQVDDWLNTHETDESAFKTRSWLRRLRRGRPDRGRARRDRRHQETCGAAESSAQLRRTGQRRHRSGAHRRSGHAAATLGGSRLGHACERALQFTTTLKHVGRDFSGQPLRILAIGRSPRGSGRRLAAAFFARDAI